MTYQEARKRIDKHIERATATRGYAGDKAAAWVEIKLLKELLKDDTVNESKEDEKMKYSVVERKIKTGEEWVTFEGNDLEEAKAEARDFAYINKRDNNGNEIMLVVTEEWEEGNYSPIDYTTEADKLSALVEGYIKAFRSPSPVDVKAGQKTVTIQPWDDEDFEDENAEGFTEFVEDCVKSCIDEILERA